MQDLWSIYFGNKVPFEVLNICCHVPYLTCGHWQSTHSSSREKSQVDTGSKAKAVCIIIHCYSELNTNKVVSMSSKYGLVDMVTSWQHCKQTVHLLVRSRYCCLWLQKPQCVHSCVYVWIKWNDTHFKLRVICVCARGKWFWNYRTSQS